MKKFLLSLVAVLCSVCAMADQVTIEVSDALWTTTAGEQTGTKDGITIATTNGVLGSESYRCYKGQTFTISSTVGNITSVEFTCTASGTAKYGPGCFTDATAGTYTATDGATGTWEGDAASFSLTASSNQVRMSKIVVTYSIGANKCSAPSLTAAGVFTAKPYEVTITNKEAGSTVYYTTDGNDPTTSSSSFTGDSKTISISETTTVKAMSAVSGKDNSAVVSATYTYEASIANTSETAYTVAQVKDIIDGGSAQLKTTEVYVKGKVSQVDSYNETYGSITYWISEDGTTDSQQFEVYGGLSFNGEMFSAVSDIQVGDEVIVKGYATLYKTSSSSTYEFSKNNVLVYRTEHSKKTPTLTAEYKTSLNVDETDNVVVNYDGDGKVTITSSDGNVADVDGGQGNTTYIGAYQEGTTTITITAPETDNFYGATITYTLTVKTPIGGIESFTNGGFETWTTDSQATGWKSATSASSATVNKSEDARNGNYAAKITGATSGNKRLGSKEFKLAAGIYTFEVYVKAANAGDSAKVAVGYVPDTLNASGAYVANGSSYNYGEYVTVGSEWTRVYKTFELTEETVINLVVMNHKSYGKDVLADDAVLRLATDEEKQALSVTGVAADKKAAKGIYTVAGQRVNATRKGINIVDGKKVYIK